MDFLSDIGRMNKRQVLLQTINLGALGPMGGAAGSVPLRGLPPLRWDQVPLAGPCGSLTAHASSPNCACRHDHHQRADDLEVAGAGHRQRVAGALQHHC